MISRAQAGLAIALLVLFSLSVWGGYALHQTITARGALNAPGWCCMAGRSVCTVAASADDCRDARGTVFNADSAACNAVCSQTAGRNARAAPTSPSR